MGVVLLVLIVFALIAAIWGRDKAQGAFHLIFGSLAVVGVIALTAAAPAIGLGSMAVVGFIYFCKSAAKDARERGERLEREKQRQRGAQGIAQMQNMLDVVNASMAATQALPSTSVPPPQPPVRQSPTPPPRPQVPPRLGQFCTNCGSAFAGGQKFCGGCGRPL
jgi:hypothetical protein